MKKKTVIYQKPASFGGSVRLPSSKSAAHRAILCAALSRKTCRLENVDMNMDVAATLRAVQALGIQYTYLPQEKTLTVLQAEMPPRHSTYEMTVDCGESGSTLRFVIPIFAVLGIRAVFTGSGRLPQRPIGIYEDLLARHGVSVQTAGGLPFSISGKLSGGLFSLSGGISSQFITGLLFALPLAAEDSEIKLTSPLESAGYIHLTLQILSQFGINVLQTEAGWKIPGRQRYAPKDMAVEGDWSHAAFFLSHAALANGGKIILEGLSPESVQGDRACVGLYRKFGVDTKMENGRLIAENPNWQKPYHGLKAISVDATQIPDLVPALALCAAFAEGTTVIDNAARLRLKESDRLLAMVNAINGLGGHARVTADGMHITGVETMAGGHARGENDHRIVMALSAAALQCPSPVQVTDAMSIEKSYPDFYTDYQMLGGIANVINMG